MLYQFCVADSSTLSTLTAQLPVSKQVLTVPANITAQKRRGRQGELDLPLWAEGEKLIRSQTKWSQAPNNSSGLSEKFIPR